jgi:acetoin utilization deacetylase AcuC-like enzyme
MTLLGEDLFFNGIARRRFVIFNNNNLMAQDGSYPGTGKFDEVGTGDGLGTTLNLPLPGGSGDTTIRTVFDEVIVPCAQRFKPDIILVSAG